MGVGVWWSAGKLLPCFGGVGLRFPRARNSRVPHLWQEVWCGALPVGHVGDVPLVRNLQGKRHRVAFAGPPDVPIPVRTPNPLNPCGENSCQNYQEDASALEPPTPLATKQRRAPHCPPYLPQPWQSSPSRAPEGVKLTSSSARPRSPPSRTPHPRMEQPLSLGLGSPIAE